MIFVNFKTYEQGTGEQAVVLAKICQTVAKKTSVKIFPVVQAVDIGRVIREVGGEIWAQHVDDIKYGPNTGQILPEAIKAVGATGTLLNHSENKLPVEVIGETLRRCRSLGLKILVCAESISEAKEIVGARPDFLVYEPPELIGSQTASVATAKPEVIRELVSQLETVPVLVGAGIHLQEDVRAAVKLGAVGVLVASDVVLAKDPKKELLDLAVGF